MQLNNLNVILCNSGIIPLLISYTYSVVQDTILLRFPALYAEDCKAVYFNATAFRSYLTLITTVTYFTTNTRTKNKFQSDKNCQI
jgi:hypothetical protein